jgi:hypothetical protein
VPDRRAQKKALNHVMLAYRLVSERIVSAPVPSAWLDQLRHIDEVRVDLNALLAFAGPRLKVSTAPRVRCCSS